MGAQKYQASAFHLEFVFSSGGSIVGLGLGLSSKLSLILLLKSRNKKSNC